MNSDLITNYHGEHEVGFSAVTWLSGNNRLIQALPELGTDLRASTHEQTD